MWGSYHEEREDSSCKARQVLSQGRGVNLWLGQVFARDSRGTELRRLLWVWSCGWIRQEISAERALFQRLQPLHYRRRVYRRACGRGVRVLVEEVAPLPSPVRAPRTCAPQCHSDR